MGILGLVAAGYAISVVLRLRSDETSERAEPVLAAAVSRVSWARSYLVVAAAGSAVVLAAAGLGAGPLVRAARRGRRHPGAAPARRGARPVAGRARGGGASRWRCSGCWPGLCVAGGWTALALAAVVMLLGPTLRLAQWIQDISPFTHVPKLPGGTVSARAAGLAVRRAAGAGGRGPGRPAPPRHRLSRRARLRMIASADLADQRGRAGLPRERERSSRPAVRPAASATSAARTYRACGQPHFGYSRLYTEPGTDVEGAFSVAETFADGAAPGLIRPVAAAGAAAAVRVRGSRRADRGRRPAARPAPGGIRARPAARGQQAAGARGPAPAGGRGLDRPAAEPGGLRARAHRPRGRPAARRARAARGRDGPARGSRGDARGGGGAARDLAGGRGRRGERRRDPHRGRQQRLPRRRGRDRGQHRARAALRDRRAAGALVLPARWPRPAATSRGPSTPRSSRRSRRATRTRRPSWPACTPSGPGPPTMARQGLPPRRAAVAVSPSGGRSG